MIMLQLRKGRQRVGDGQRSVVPLVRRRGRKYGPILAEKALSVRRDLLVCGANQSGKSRWLGRLYGESAGVWKGRPALYLRSVNPLLAWVEDDRVVAWYEKGGLEWRRLRVWERSEQLIAWAEETHPVLLLDDAQLLTGRKADIALRLVRAAGRVVTSCTAEGRIPISIRLALQQREPERVYLNSEAPFDVTVFLAWLFAVIALGAGAWQVAAAFGGLNLLTRGGRSAKQS